MEGPQIGTNLRKSFRVTAIELKTDIIIFVLVRVVWSE